MALHDRQVLIGFLWDDAWRYAGMTPTVRAEANALRAIAAPRLAARIRPVPLVLASALLVDVGLAPPSSRLVSPRLVTARAEKAASADLLA